MKDKWDKGSNQPQGKSNVLKPSSSEGKAGSYRKAVSGKAQDDNDGDEGGRGTSDSDGDEGHKSVPQTKTPPRHHGMTPAEQMKLVMMAHALRQAQPQPQAPPQPPMGPPGMPPQGMMR